MEREEIITDVRTKAEAYFQRGDSNCSESVIYAFSELFGWPFEHSNTPLVSDIPAEINKSGCICGAISGGVIVLKMAFGRNPGDAINCRKLLVVAELHDHTRKLYKSTCCQVITKDFLFDSPEQKGYCANIIGEVTAWLADKLLEDEEFMIKFNL